jgi:hypothetical protein
MRIHHVVFTLVLSIAAAGPASGKDDSKKELIEQNAANIAALEQKTTLSDLSCQIDEIASFNGSSWVCGSAASLLTIYEVRRPLTLTSHPTLPITTRWDAFCSIGDLAIGGGFETPAGSFSYRVTASHLYTDTRAWSTSIAIAAGTIELSGAAYAYCLDLTP